MRSYPTNSPQAAARIVALTLLADGHVDGIEMDALERAGAYAQLGLGRADLHTVLQHICEDLLHAQGPHWSGAGQIEPETLMQLMAEVQAPGLRMQVLNLCVAAASADGHVAEGESTVLLAVFEQWGLRPHTLPAPPSPVHT